MILDQNKPDAPVAASALFGRIVVRRLRFTESERLHAFGFDVFGQQVID
jgi:hypothetical protein